MTDIDILEEIVRLEGVCLMSDLCHYCPFKAECIPSFIDHLPMTEPKVRLKKALTALTNVLFLNDSTLLEAKYDNTEDNRDSSRGSHYKQAS